MVDAPRKSPGQSSGETNTNKDGKRTYLHQSNHDKPSQRKHFTLRISHSDATDQGCGSIVSKLQLTTQRRLTDGTEDLALLANKIMEQNREVEAVSQPLRASISIDTQFLQME
ncbi:hypothetical protein EVAR_2383_1 [Eumeta japonica]|uniref:Uncharacterized protein n=1 Tax=Eumeta variegata TaxID=151549 RepID=A0A4C2AH61_EUMVA|nr:hypothetical protein EVAR_2383_1 [Eumeta japonica]